MAQRPAREIETAVDATGARTCGVLCIHRAAPFAPSLARSLRSSCSAGGNSGATGCTGSPAEEGCTPPTPTTPPPGGGGGRLSAHARLEATIRQRGKAHAGLTADRDGAEATFRRIERDVGVAAPRPSLNPLGGGNDLAGIGV